MILKKPTWAFVAFALLIAFSVFSAVSAQDKKADEGKNHQAVTESSATTEATNTTEKADKPLTWRDLIFPLVCGLGGIPIFIFVIAAAIYQPFHKKKRDEKKRYEEALEKKKRSDSATEKYRMLQQQISISHAPRESDSKRSSLSNV